MFLTQAPSKFTDTGIIFWLANFSCTASHLVNVSSYVGHPFFTPFILSSTLLVYPSLHFLASHIQDNQVLII